jgi:hypothetical protein
MVKGPGEDVHVAKGRMNAGRGKVSWVGSNSRNLAHLRDAFKVQGLLGKINQPVSNPRASCLAISPNAAI